MDPFYWTQPQPRIVQYKKRRFAMRLEAVFWQQLERIAKRRGQRLGQLVAGLAEMCEGVNLTSFVRGFCMVEAEMENARYRLAAGGFDLTDVMRSCPAPALLLTDDRVILEINPALQRWVDGVPHEAAPMRQQRLEQVFEPRIGRALDETVEQLRQGKLKRAQFQMAYIGDAAMTRNVMASMSGLSVGSVFYLLIWLTVNASYRVDGITPL